MKHQKKKGKHTLVYYLHFFCGGFRPPSKMTLVILQFFHSSCTSSWLTDVSFLQKLLFSRKPTLPYLNFRSKPTLPLPAFLCLRNLPYPTSIWPPPYLLKNGVSINQFNNIKLLSFVDITKK